MSQLAIFANSKRWNLKSEITLAREEVHILVNCKSIRTTDNPNPQLGANNPPIISAKPRVRVIGCPDTFAIDEYREREFPVL